MPGLQHVHLMRRISLIFSVLMVLLFLVQPFAVNPAFAADSADSDAIANRQEDYEQLKKGKRIWTNKTYVKPERPTVYLTFDDGPSKLTDKVLDILREEGVLATFFMLGEQADAYPGKVRQVADEGHAIGNHTYNHKYNELYTGVASFWQQIEQTGKALEEAAGIKTQLVRAPGGTYGNFDAFYFYYLDQAGFEIHDWNIDSGDAKRVGVPADEIIRNVSNGPFGDEVIVLMHDGTGHEQTVKALPEIIRLFKAKGYDFAPLTEHVQPVHFSAGKSKWDRSVGPALHNKLLAEAGRHKLALEEPDKATKPLPAQAEANQTGAVQSSIVKEALSGNADPNIALAELDKDGSSDGHTDTESPEQQLEIELGGGKLLLEPGEYRLTGGQYLVPLRRLLEAMGGQTQWQESRRTAAVHYGFRFIEYDFSRFEMRVNEGGSKTIYHFPQMELRDGSVLVPLRKTVELLGSRIDFQQTDKGLIQIGIARNGRLMVPYGFSG